MAAARIAVIRVIPVLAIAAMVAACAGRRPAAEVRLVGGIIVACEPDNAQLFVDDRYVGTVSALKGRPLMLPEGIHRLEIQLDGYFAHYAEVKVVKGVRQRLEVRLRKEPFR